VSLRTKLSLVAIVLVAGIVLAWQFRKRGEESSAAAESSATQTGPARFGPAGASVASSPKAVRAGQDNPVASPTTHLTSASAALLDGSPTRPKPSLGDDGAVPELSSAFPGTLARDTRTDSPFGFDRDASPRLEGMSGLPGGPTHRVADGDTLVRLAERYLGSAERWRELYEFNRDVLTNPELLPIGAELRIPTTPFRPAPQEPAAAGQITARPVSQSLAPAAEPPTSLDANLVPVQGGPSGSAGERAEPGKQNAPLKLQRLPPVAPVGRVLRVAPRTYVVQSGDTLNSIAERLYGDGAKETILLQANRNLVAGSQEIRAGMVLIVPLDSQ
jgi:nucleoid-associated protein YgaU